MISSTTIPPDDGARQLTLVDPENETLPHLAVGGDTYTILISGEDTAGRYALLDMLISAAGGPPPHRHDFEEMFQVLDGEVDVTIRGETTRVRTGDMVNIPALAPHRFYNPTERTARLLCLVAPAGLEAFFAEFADRVATRASPGPKLTENQIGERTEKAQAAATKYRIQLL